MAKKITIDELRREVNKVLSVSPDMSASEIWLALQKKYPYSVIEQILADIENEKVAKLRSIDAEIKVVDERGNEISLGEYINAKKQEKKR